MMERAKPMKSPGASLRTINRINLPTMKRILVILLAIILLVSCSRVSGTYVSDGGGLVEQIEFVGKNSCVLTYFGMKLPASYRMDNGHIVADAGQNLIVMFKVQDSNTLVGESEWNNAIYRKIGPISNSQESEP